MSIKECHLAVAERNQITLDWLLRDTESHSPWIATVAFYKALHLVEAAFTTNPDFKHHHSHEAREKYLKRTRRYAQIWKFYRLLWSASVVARYLEDRSGEYSSFSDYLSPDDVKSKVVGYWLREVEKSVGKVLGGVS